MTPEKEKIYQELFVENSRRLYQYIYRNTGNRSDTEDIIQEVFIVLLFRLNGFAAEYPDNAKQIRSWLFRVADNKLLHYWRDQKLLDAEVSIELLPDLPDLADPQAGLESVDLLLPDWLDPEDKQLIYWKYSGYSLQEIAVRLGITHGACRMRSSRLADSLKKYFEK